MDILLRCKARELSRADLICLMIMRDWDPVESIDDILRKGVVDVCVYGRNQQFRMLENSKIGKNCSLRPMHSDGNVEHHCSFVPERNMELHEERYKVYVNGKDAYKFEQE